MIRVYCDICGQEIVEDSEGIDWKDLQLRRLIDYETVGGIEHICGNCEQLVQAFVDFAKAKPPLSDRKEITDLLNERRRLHLNG